MHAGTANAAPFALEWSAPEGCPARERVVAASLARLKERESSAVPELYVRGDIVFEDGAIIGEFRVRDAAGVDLGERRVRFDESRCEDIVESAALVLAMMIAVARPHVPPSQPAVVPVPVPEPKPESAPLPHPERTPPRAATARAATRVPMTLGASAVASAGFLPNAGFGGALRWTATLGRGVVLGVEGSFEAAQPVEVLGARATFRSVDVGALAGVRILRSEWIELVPMLEARGGIVIVSTSGFRSAYDTTRFASIVGAGVLARIPLGPMLRLDVLPDVRVPLNADAFMVRERGELFHVHRPAPVEGRVAVGIAVEFP